MQAHLLLSEIQNQGLNIQTIEGNLHIYPRKRITDAIRNTIRQHKTALVDFLERYEERTAIMEHDAGLSRQDAEVAAFNDLTKGQKL